MAISASTVALGQLGVHFGQNTRNSTSSTWAGKEGTLPKAISVSEMAISASTVALGQSGVHFGPNTRNSTSST